MPEFLSQDVIDRLNDGGSKKEEPGISHEQNSVSPETPPVPPVEQSAPVEPATETVSEALSEPASETPAETPVQGPDSELTVDDLHRRNVLLESKLSDLEATLRSFLELAGKPKEAPKANDPPEPTTEEMIEVLSDPEKFRAFIASDREKVRADAVSQALELFRQEQFQAMQAQSEEQKKIELRNAFYATNKELAAKDKDGNLIYAPEVAKTANELAKLFQSPSYTGTRPSTEEEFMEIVADTTRRKLRINKVRETADAPPPVLGSSGTRVAEKPKTKEELEREQMRAFAASRWQ